MNLSRKKKKNKRLTEHTDYCKCYDCNDGMLTTNYKKGKKKLINKIKESISQTKSIIPSTGEGFEHSKTCLCPDCVKATQTSTPTLDHTVACVCYKCNKDKELGRTGKSTSSNYSSNYSSSYTPCHEGNVFVFKKDGIFIYGAGNLKDPEPNKVDIVLDLDRNVRTTSWEVDIPETWKSRELAKSNVIILDLFIKDMYAPEHITAEFWKLFWDDLKTEAKKHKGNTLKVLVMCQGGHGRTGVVIASLIMASAYNKKGIPKDMHPVGWLRKNYCEKAVESLRQTDYLTKIWGMRFVEASKSTTSFGAGATSTNGSGNKNTVDPDEIPKPDTRCSKCNTLRTTSNRILFSADVKKFECDKCFGKRADDAEENDDHIEKCNSELCFDEYNDMTGVWKTIHSHIGDCEEEEEDTDCGGQWCGFHSNTMSEGLIHTYDSGCTAEEGEKDLDTIPVNNMTEEQYEDWAKSLL